MYQQIKDLINSLIRLKTLPKSILKTNLSDILDNILDYCKDNFISNTGTNGNPITGNININKGNNSIFKIEDESTSYAFGLDNSAYNEFIGFYMGNEKIAGVDTGTFIVGSDSANNIVFNVGDNGRVGIYSNHDYKDSNPENKLIYAQRSYVDTKIPIPTPNGVGSVLTDVNGDGVLTLQPPSGGGSVPTLQQVTAAGNISSNDITISPTLTSPTGIRLFTEVEFGDEFPVYVNGININDGIESESYSKLSLSSVEINFWNFGAITAGNNNLRTFDDEGFFIRRNNVPGDVGNSSFRLKYPDLPSIGKTVIQNIPYVSGIGVVYSNDSIASPATPTPTSNGVKGELRVFGNYLYICVQTNQWKRALLEITW